MAEVEGDEEWRRFTPKVIDESLCMARTWNMGVGGQCSSKPGKEGQAFCTRHFNNDLWAVHGRVDGPIPEKKLREFVRTANGELGKKRAPKPASGNGERCNKKAKKGKPSPQSDGIGDEDEEVPTSSGAVPRASPGKRSSEDTTPQKPSQLKRGRAKRAAEAQVTTPRNTKAPKKQPAAARRTEKGKAKVQFPKCTCGKPIHSEKCKLFRPGFLPGFLPSRRAARPARPLPSEFRGREPLSPVKTVPPPSVKLSRMASEQVAKISEEIHRLPKPQRKAAWKQQMRTYHPDKKSVFPNLSEAQMNEVFVEIKRRYDFAMRTEGEDQLIPPARQFWGSCR